MIYSDQLKEIINDFNNRFNPMTLEEAVLDSLGNMKSELADVESRITDIYNAALGEGLDEKDPFFKQYDDFKEAIENMKEQLEMETNYKESVREFNGLKNEVTNLVMTKRPSDELGLKELRSINTRYRDVDKRHLEYLDKIKSIKMAPEKRKALLAESDKFIEASRRNLDFLRKEIRRKQHIEARLRKEEKDLLQKIKENQAAIKALRDQIKHLADDPTKNNVPKLHALNAEIKKHQDRIKGLKERIEVIKKNYRILQNGGKLIEMKAPERVDPIVEREPAKEETEEPKKGAEEPKKEESEPKKEAKKEEEAKVNNTPAPTRRGPGKSRRTPGPKKPPQPMNLETLRATGKIPGADFLSDEQLIDICDQLNINITDAKTPIPKEKIDRLLQDRAIQAATLYAGVSARYQKRIGEYDKLIAKYNSLINDHSESLSPEYKARLKGYIDKLEGERKAYTDEMHQILVEQELGSRGIEKRAQRKNNKIRREYDKLDLYTEEKEMFSTAKMKKKADKKIAKTLAKIEKLQGKRGKLADKQTKIVNKNSQKYIEEVEKKIEKYLAKRDKIIENVDELQEIYDNITAVQRERAANAQELEQIAKGKKSINTAFRTTGIMFDNMILKDSVRRLYSKYGRTDTRMQHKVEAATRHM